MATSENPPLSTDAIVEAAMSVAVVDGLDAVSMRRIGSELGYSGMSLYTHVAGKEELLDLLADRVLAEVPELDPELAWEESIGRFFSGLHGVLVQYKELGQIVTRRPTRGPSAARHSRAVLAALDRAGLSQVAAVEAYIALCCYTIGAAQYMGGRPSGAARDASWVLFGEPEFPLDTAGRRQLARRAGKPQFRSGLDHLIRGYSSEIGGPEKRGVT
jgi:AcrR family transcriptional regulator